MLTVSIAKLVAPVNPRPIAAHETSIDGDPAGDQQALAEVRAAFGAMTADAPLLLLPLRIETRFVAAPYRGVDELTPARATAGLVMLRGHLDSLATVAHPPTRPANETPAARKARKDAARVTLRLLVRKIRVASMIAFSTRRTLRSCIALPADAAELAHLRDARTFVADALNRSKAHLAGYPFAFTRGRLDRLVRKLEDKHVAPLLRDLDAALPAIELSTRLAWVWGDDVTARCATARAAVQATLDGTAPWSAARTALDALVEATWKIIRAADPAAITTALLGARDALRALLQRPLAAQTLTEAAAYERQFGPVVTVDQPRLRAIGAAAGEVTAEVARNAQLAAGSPAAQVVTSVERLAALVRALVVVPATAPQIAQLATVLPRMRAVLVAWRAASAAAGHLDRARVIAIGQLDRALASLTTGVQALRRDAAAPSPERRVLLVAADARTRLRPELWVRIFPDDVAHTGHVDALEVAETEAGTAFWAAIAKARGDREAAAMAWRSLATRFGPRRAAWIRERTQPPTTAPTAVPWEPLLYQLRAAEQQLAAVTDARTFAPAPFELVLDRALAALRTQTQLPDPVFQGVAGRLEALRGRTQHLDRERARLQATRLASALAKLDTLVAELPARAESGPVPTPRLKQTSITPPRAAVLPRRFVVVTAQAGLVTHAVTGAPVAPDLPLGLAGDDARITVDGDGNLQVPAAVRWLFDFDAAVQAGMAVRVPISEAEMRQGFDRVYVLGLAEGDPARGKATLEKLLAGHRFGPRGLAFVPYGSPTNNTESELAAWRSTESADEEWRRITDPTQVRIAGDPTTDVDAARWASACGIDPAVLHDVAHAHGSSLAAGELAKRALAPGTLGAYLEDMTGSLLDAEQRRAIFDFYQAAVSPRGVAPTLRIGHQPYGLLVTTAFSLLDATAPVAGVAVTHPTFEQRFHEVLAVMRRDFLRIANAAVPHAHSPHVASAQAHFLRILGTYAHSLEYTARFAVNASFSHVPAGGASPHAQGPLGVLERFMDVALAAIGRPHEPRPLAGGLPIAPLVPILDALKEARPFDLRLLRKPKPVASVADERTPDELVRMARLDIAALRIESLDPSRLDRPLVDRLVRHARLYAWLVAALDILMRETRPQATGALTDPIRSRLGSADGFAVATASDAAYVSKFSYLTTALSNLNGALGVTFDAGRPFFANLGGYPMAHYLAQLVAGAPGPDPVERARLLAHRSAIERFAELEPEVLGRATAEHLDTVSHRLDAWLSGLAHRRLATMRSRGLGTGILLGAYGWVHDLRPDETPGAEHADLPAVFKGHAGTLRHDPRNEGFIHTPSIQHAIAAAVLRSTYVAESRSERATDVSNRMAINLSSRRVRLALELVDGVRKGSPLAALLGYRIERALHDRRDGLVYDDLVFALRRAYPTATTTDPTSPNPLAVRQVIDGQRMLDDIYAWLAQRSPTWRSTGRLLDALIARGAAGYPWGLRGLPAAGDPRLIGVLAAVDEAADALDAIGDLALAEGVYQIGRGNRVRAGAVMQALAEGRAMPAPEIVEFPRTGTIVSHRVIAFLDGSVLPAGWSSTRTRAVAEPRLNAWVGTLLGPAARYELTVWLDDVAHPVSLDQLGFAPLDLLAAFDAGGAADAAALRWTALLAVATPAALAAAQRVEIDFAARTAGKPSVDHAAALLEAVADALRHARSLEPAEYHVRAAGDALDPAELRARLAALELVVRTFGELLHAEHAPQAAPSSWTTATLDTPAVLAPTRVAAVLALLARAASFGIAGALPERWTGSAADLADLADRLVRVLRELQVRVRALASAAGGALSSPACASAIRALLGEGFLVIEPFTIDPARAPAAVAVEGEALDQFCTTAAFVRPALRRLGHARDLASLAAVTPPAPRVLQHPPGPWAGGELDAAVAGGEITCITSFGAPPTGSCGALRLDSWIDIVPAASEVSGVAVAYDQPDAQPPQSMLLVVPPRLHAGSGSTPRRWAFDDVVIALDDTLDLAKIRAVEPEHLADEPYGLLLPMTVGEILPRAVEATPTDVTGERVMLDFGTNG